MYKFNMSSKGMSPTVGVIVLTLLLGTFIVIGSTVSGVNVLSVSETTPVESYNGNAQPVELGVNSVSEGVEEVITSGESRVEYYGVAKEGVYEYNGTVYTVEKDYQITFLGNTI